MAILLGCDNAAVSLKDQLKVYLHAQGLAVEDVGVHQAEDNTLYPDVAQIVAERIARAEASRGILLCGTGIGMSIVANKVPGVRAALCHDCFSAERARKSNDAQIITMGSRVIGPELAKQILASWLAAEFTEGPSSIKIQRISELEQQNHV